jgi:serine/threonine-protein kinase/endoribonuclease IRE1
VGSHGTVVYEGRMMPGGRRVAVKRLLRQFYESARKEISLLVELDEASPHVVRYFAMEEDADFIYLALELCGGALGDRVREHDAPSPPKSYTTGPLPRATVRALRQMMQGLADLHRQNIVHRDLKPQNVLCHGCHLKIADVGLALRLDADRSSYTAVSNAAGGVGTTGWRAPEVLSGGRQTRAVDVFAAGCIISFVVTSGDHPFGSEVFGRDGRIVAGEADLRSLAALQAPDALDVVERMLGPRPADRPSVAEALRHPFFWTDAAKLAFLVDISDRLFDLRHDSVRYTERLDESALAVRHCSDWPARMDGELMREVGAGYIPSASNLLRVVRNKRNHYSELSPRMQKMLGPLPDDEDSSKVERLGSGGGGGGSGGGGDDTPRQRELDEHNFLTYFLRRVPQLLMCVYAHALNYPELVRQPHFTRYGFKSASAEHDLLPLHPRVARLRDSHTPTAVNGGGPALLRERPETCSPGHRPGAAAGGPRVYYQRGALVAMSSTSAPTTAPPPAAAEDGDFFSPGAGERWRERLTTGVYDNPPAVEEGVAAEGDASAAASSMHTLAPPAPGPPLPSLGPPPGFGSPGGACASGASGHRPRPPPGFAGGAGFGGGPRSLGFGRTFGGRQDPPHQPDDRQPPQRNGGSAAWPERKPALGFTPPGEGERRDWGGLRRGGSGAS